ncbi:hypothetical protein FE257_011036 [Aspergillus nanangensis]|uniref:NAD(P)-binding protein n=1 Tax=Aspergillus nanangensis TaxID=2582783 RepID=A0AAD4CIP0_ASPNN|nr:hypothetical protein FE257_011036 [Aspergillus nanangensis]
MSTDQKIVFITGANQGIGLSTAKTLLQTSPTYHIILGTRNLTNGTTALAQLSTLPNILGTASTLQIDVTDDASVDAAAASIRQQFGRLDILINNAGIVTATKPEASLTEAPSRSTLRAVLNTNVAGALSTTEACLDLLRESSERRIVFVSSSMGSITHAADPGSPYYRAQATEYRVSKAAVNMMMVMYWVRLQGEGFKVFGADPGLCATDFVGDAEALRRRGAVEADEGGRRVASVVTGERDADVGRVLGVYGVSPF